MPKAKKFFLPYDDDPPKSETTKKKRRGKRSEKAMERRKKEAIAHREVALQQPREGGELQDSDVVNVLPNVDEPQAQVIVAEDGSLEMIAGRRPRKRRKARRSEEARERMRQKSMAYREAKEAKEAALRQLEDGELLDPRPKVQVTVADDTMGVL